MTGYRLYAVLLGSAALVSCGGGGSSGGTGGGGSPTPTPTSPSTPPPTPAPTFTYTKFVDLTGDQHLPTACIGYSPRGNDIPAVEGLDTFSIDDLLGYTDSTQTWAVIVPNSLNASFGPSNLVSSSTAKTDYQKTVGSQTETFQYSQPVPTADYGRLAKYVLADGTGFAASAVCAFGVPTDPNDVPAATTVTFANLTVDGTVYEVVGAGPATQTSDIIDGTGTITGNKTNGEVTISFSYRVRAPGGAITTVGPVQGTLSVDLANSRAGYWGLLNMGGSPEYQVAGGFFGPQGVETGFVFDAALDLNHDGLNEKFIIGRLFARR